MSGMQRNLFRLMGGLIVVLALQSAVCLGQSVDWKSQMHNHEQKWNEYLTALGNVEGSYLYKDIRNGKQEREFTNSVVCAYPLFADIRGRLDAPISIEATGKKYRFSLERSDTSDGLIVEDVSTDLQRQSVPLSFPEHFSDTSIFATNPDGYAIFNKTGVGLFCKGSIVNLPYVLTSEYVTVREISVVEKDDEKLLHMIFDYKQKNYSMKADAFLTMDFFLVREGNFFVESGLGIEDVQVKVTYDNVTYKVPLPKNYYIKNTYNMVVDGEKFQGILETVRDFDLRETKSESFKYFTLSGYGLPEPDFGERSVGWLRYLLMTAGGLLIVYALWRMYRERKEK